MKRAMHELMEGDWFIANLNGEQSVYVAGKMISGRCVRTCACLWTGSIADWDSRLNVEKIDPDKKDYLLDEATL